MDDEKKCLFPSEEWKPCDKDCIYFNTCTRRKDRDERGQTSLRSAKATKCKYWNEEHQECSTSFEEDIRADERAKVLKAVIECGWHCEVHSPESLLEMVAEQLKEKNNGRIYRGNETKRKNT